MVAPKNTGPVRSDILVQRVLDRCFVERRPLSEHREKDSGGCEQINALSRVALAHVKLWCHVSRRAALGLQKARTISAIDGTTKTEVGHLESALLVKQQIFGF